MQPPPPPAPLNTPTYPSREKVLTPFPRNCAPNTIFSYGFARCRLGQGMACVSSPQPVPTPIPQPCKYIQDLNASDLNIGVFSGDVTLKDLKLRSDALDNLNLPVDVQKGYILALPPLPSLPLIELMCRGHVTSQVPEGGSYLTHP